MTPDVFEDRLRAHLHGATEAEAGAFIDIDATQVLGTGHRVVRRRRLALAAGSLAAATVVGVGAWAVLDGSGARAVDQVPATRLPATRSTGAIAPDVVSAALRVTDAGPGSAVAGYTVRLDRSTGRVTATQTSATGAAGPEVTVGTIPVGKPRAVWEVVSRDPFVVVGALPSDAVELMGRFTGGDIGGVTTRTADLATTSYQAFLFQSEKPSPRADLRGLDWSTAGGVFSADGSALPSAAFGDGRLVYVDAAGGEMGLVTPEGAALVPLQRVAADAPTGHVTSTISEGGKAGVTTFATVLPIDAGDIAVRVAPGTTLVSKDERPLLGGSGVAVIATVEGSGTQSPVVTGLTWTANGRQVTWQNPD